MPKPMIRTVLTATVIAGAVVLGACSADLKDDGDSVSTERRSNALTPAGGGTSSSPGSGQADSGEPGTGEPGSGEPGSGESGSGESGQETDDDLLGLGDLGDNLGDLGDNLAELGDMFDEDFAGDLEIGTVPENGVVTKAGIFSCDGKPITVKARVNGVILTDSCPAVTVEGAGSNVVLGSDTPTTLVVSGDSNEVVGGEVESVDITGSSNTVTAGTSSDAAVRVSGDENDVVFGEAREVTIEGGRNWIRYYCGPEAVDNGTRNDIKIGPFPDGIRLNGKDVLQIVPDTCPGH